MQRLETYFVLIYFVYGLSFFTMGLTLLLEARRTTQLNLIHHVHLIGWFGLIHGLNEFSDMFGLVGLWPDSIAADGFRVILLLTSFLPLFAFGLSQLPPGQGHTRRIYSLTGLAAGLTLIQFGLVYVFYDQPAWHDWFAASDTITRFFIGIPAGALAGFGLLRQRRELVKAERASFSLDFTIAGWALVTYGVIGQAFPEQGILFPTAWLNANLFTRLFGMPPQMLRSLLAVVIGITAIRILRASEHETTDRLAQARQTRLDLQNAVRELSLLYETSTLLSTSYDLQTLTQKALERIIMIVEPIRAGAILIPRAGYRDEYFARSGYDAEQAEQLYHLLVTYTSASAGQNSHAYWVDHAGQDVSAFIEQAVTDIRRAEPVPLRRVAMRLVAREQIVGAILLDCLPEGPYLSSLEAPTILALSRQLAVAIANAELVLELRQREAMQTTLLQRTTFAQEEERKRIARELHDATGQALTALAMGLKGTAKILNKDPVTAQRQIESLQGMSSTALGDLRHLISDLRPSHLDDLGLVSALRWYAEQIQERGGLKVDFTTQGETIPLSPETETMIFRIVQEGLINTIKHARASCIDVRLHYSPHQIELHISDNGCGFDVDEVLKPGERRAWGLIGIQERAALVGAALQIDSAAGKGTDLYITVPVTQGEPIL